jgi:steroid 5-alpha reductase family enzyme
MITVLLLAAGVLVAMSVVMTVGWATQRAVKNGGWTDVFWTYGTGATCALAALAPFGAEPGVLWRRILVALLIALWSLRLGTYVARRVSRSPEEDPRYAAFRRDWGGDFQRRMFQLMIVQAPVTALLSLSVILAARQPAAASRVWDVLGVIVFFVCLAGEALADSQLHAFRADPANRGKVCDTGLWSWSRHPNYFFEAAIWLAWPIIAVDFARPWTLISLLAPVMMYLTVRYASGVPPLEEAMLKSRGDAYRRYQARVSVLIPLPPKA